jgi:hypothetical protein
MYLVNTCDYLFHTLSMYEIWKFAPGLLRFAPRWKPVSVGEKSGAVDLALDPMDSTMGSQTNSPFINNPR